MKNIKVLSVGLVLLSTLMFLAGCGNTEKPKDEPLEEKPVIYLYPEDKMDVEVKLGNKDRLTCSYPEYKEGWKVTASPDGTLVSKDDGREYSYLYWEGKSDVKFDMSNGFVVAGKDTREFLQDKLAYLGLTPKEYNEFIVYWLPRLEANKYNLIHFAGEEYDRSAELNISPKPDTVIRVMMVYKSLDKPIEIEEQKLEKGTRKGFLTIEWGGTANY